MTRPCAAFLFAVLIAVPATAAERNFSVTGYDRVRVDGPYVVRLTTGVAPFARASGSAGALDGVAIDLNGRTLIVRPNRSSWGGSAAKGAGPVTIEIGTHELTSAWLNGAGSLDISKIKGLSFDMSVNGAGSMRIAAADVDQLKLALAGSGSARLGGKAARLTAVVRGISTLDAGDLAVKDAVIGAEGPSTVRMTVTGTAKINAQGAAQVELAGNAACTVTAGGSATVSGCD